MAATLKSGSQGDDVRSLQTALNAQGYNLTVDGIYGSNTLSAVKAYQQQMGLTVDGIVGANTWGALGGGSSAAPSAAAAYPVQSAAQAAAGGSGTVNAGYSYDQLLSEINRNTYTAKTEAEIQAQAKSSYDPIYNANVQGLNQGAESYYLALEQQLTGLNTSYDRQREDTAKAYANAESSSNRNMLQRGMARSSYGAQVAANIATEGAKAQNDIGEAQTKAESNLHDQRTLYEKQLGEQLTRLAADYETNVSNYANEMRDSERDRATAAQQYGNQLAMSLYELALSEQQWNAQFNESQRQFAAQLAENQRQFDASLAKSSGSSGSGGSNNKNTQTPQSATPPLEDYLSSLFGGSLLTNLDPYKWSVGGTAYNNYSADGNNIQTSGSGVTETGTLIKKPASTQVKKTTGGNGMLVK